MSGNPDSIIIRYPLDLSGFSETNLVLDEVHILEPAIKRAIIPKFGPYYTKSLVVKDVINNRTLEVGTDYIPIFYVAEASRDSAQEVCSGIVIINQNVSSDVSIRLQYVGGDYQRFTEVIFELLERVNLDERPVAYGDLLGVPNLFPPTAHYHNARDLYGFEYMVSAIERLKDAVLLGDVQSHAEIIQIVNARYQQVMDALAATELALRESLNTHMDDTNNPHAVNKAQVGLGNVSNFNMATEIQAIAELADSILDGYMSPKRVVESILRRCRTAGDNNIGAIRYNGNNKEVGMLYSGTQVPDGVNVLNYDGYFRATQVFDGDQRVYSPNNPMPLALPDRNGTMSKEDKAKLNGVETNANKYIHPVFELTPGIYSKVTVNSDGHITAVHALQASDVPTLNQDTTGNAATATKIRTPVRINGVSFDASTDITIPVTLPINAAYVQYPNLPAPATLFGGVWEALFETEGVFFRTPGGSASAFNAGVQNFAMVAHRHHSFSGASGNSNGDINANRTPAWILNNTGSGGRRDYSIRNSAAADASRGLTGANLITQGSLDSTLTYHAAADEVRPRNRTIRVWVRRS